MLASLFEGFTTGGAATTLPAQFFVDVLPEIEDEAELRVTLYALYAIARRKGQLRAVSARELASEAPLARCFERLGGGEAVAAAIAAALAQAAIRGTLLACPLDGGDTLYFVNNDGGRRNLARVRSGALATPGATVGQPASPSPAAGQPAPPAQVYEQEIGTLTPSVSEALAEAGARYPEQWIVDALRESAISNARSWRYAAAILERWGTNGRDGADSTKGTSDASSERNPRAAARGDDPYERVVRRSWP